MIRTTLSFDKFATDQARFQPYARSGVIALLRFSFALPGLDERYRDLSPHSPLVVFTGVPVNL